MGLNVTGYGTYQYESADVLKNVAKDILSRDNSAENAQKIIDRAFLNTDRQIKELYTNQELAVLKASTQITLNNSLKETLKYLRNHSNKHLPEKHVLGEIWNIFSANNQSSEKNPYNGELAEFVIDKNIKNIFAA